MNSSWQFNTSFWVLAVVGVFLAASLWFFLRCLRREGSGKSHLWLHLLRLLVAGAVAFTLLRPERVLTLRHEEQPRVLILWDGSDSMKTEDVLDEKQQPLTRADWLKTQVDAKFWTPLENRYLVSVEPFSVPPTDPNNSSAAEIGSDLATPLEQAAKKFTDLRAVFMLSDGDWNLGQNPVSAASALTMKDVPIFTLTVGNETFLPDLEVVSVMAPSYSLMNERVSAMVSLQSRLNREVRTAINLTGPGGVQVTKPVVIQPNARIDEVVIFAPQQEGEADYKVSVALEKEEVFPNNNEKTFHLAVRKETLRVLVVDSQPRWEFRYLRNALMRDPGVHVNCVLYHPQLGMGAGNGYLPEFPQKKEDLQAYDVIFLGDVGIGEQLTKENAEMIRGLVEQQASGLVFLPGSLGRQKNLADSPLGDLLPVEMDFSKGAGFTSTAENKLELTMRGKDHWLTMLATDAAANQAVWKSLPGFYWYAPVVKSKPGSEVLAVHQIARHPAHGRLPLLVTRNFGNGKVLFMGTDSAWRWRKGVEDTYHYRFWGQVVRWMSHQRHLAQEEGIRFFYTPETPRRGDKVRLNATVLDKVGVPIGDGKVKITLTSPGGVAETIELASENAEWGVFSGQFIPREGGKYEVEVSSETAGRSMKTQLAVTVPTLEKIGQPARGDVLRELAAITRGQHGGTGDLASLLSKISVLPEPKPVEQRFRLWCHPGWCATLIGLLVVYWVGRKWIGLA